MHTHGEASSSQFLHISDPPMNHYPFGVQYLHSQGHDATEHGTYLTLWLAHDDDGLGFCPVHPMFPRWDIRVGIARPVRGRFGRKHDGGGGCNEDVRRGRRGRRRVEVEIREEAAIGDFDLEERIGDVTGRVPLEGLELLFGCHGPGRPRWEEDARAGEKRGGSTGNRSQLRHGLLSACWRKGEGRRVKRTLLWILITT